MLDQKIAQEVIDCALSTGGDFAEIFYEDRLNNGVMMRSGKVESINSGRLHGAGVRVYLGLRGVYVYTNDTTREGLLACARRAASALHADSRDRTAAARDGICQLPSHRHPAFAGENGAQN